MIAGDIMTTQIRPWLAEQNTTRLRLLVPAISIVLVWWLSISGLGQAGWVAIVGYCVLHLILIFIRQYTIGETLAHRIASAATVIDILLALVSGIGIFAIGGAIYPLAAILALRVFTDWRRLKLITLMPLAMMLGYLVAGQLVRIPALAAIPIVTAWWMVVAGIGVCLLAILTNMSQRREVERLRQALRTESQIREARVAELERTTNELRMRMREQHALEEGLRAVTSSLSLNEVLHQIVDSTVQTLGREHVSGMDLSLLVDDELTHHSYTRDGSDSQPWASVLSHRAMQQGVPLIISDATHHDEFAALGHRLRSAISVPLFVGEGLARGALTVVSGEAAAFSSSNTRHLAAFAAQAGIAIGNAELHSQMREQQRLLEAVIRDINDGLIVVNDASDIVLTNPTGQYLLNASSESNAIYDRLMELAASARTGDTATVVGELKIKPEGEISDEPSAGERVYQALASRIQQDADSQLVAIVLHDITHYRAEERARTEFISMVSHELRNPLHSLNGFLKVVIQGRAGTLAPLQQDFLQMADEQVELLKGRISELLEFNRMRAGRLTLKPRMNDLSLLMVGTVNRLTLQAEQTGLQLISRVSSDLPECVFDSERIGQVLTNLIENAIKATPPGGKISVSSHLYDHEIQISISDTGIGIAPGDIGKIFQRFYRANTQKSVYGNHLGLGLAICQQIVEGHGGRIWVESELNVGSTFSFALPLVSEEVGAEVA
jgi:signal transduction histidine kinase